MDAIDNRPHYSIAKNIELLVAKVASLLFKVSSLLFGSILQFSILFKLNFLVAPSVTSERVAFIIVAVAFIFSRKPRIPRLPRIYWGFLIFMIALGGYTTLLMLTGTGDDVGVKRCAYFILQVLILPILLYNIYRGKLTTFLLHIAGATTIQAIFIFISIISPDYRMWLANTMVLGGNVPLDDISRYAGLSNGAGAAHSLIQSTGVLALAMLLFIHKKLPSHTRVGILILMLVITVSAAFSARTGMLIGLLVIVYTLIVMFHIRPIFVLFATVSGAVILFIIITIAQNLDTSSFGIPAAYWEYTLNWISEPFVKLHHSSVVYVLTEKQKITSLPWLYWILGTGQVSLPNGLNASGHDSGYIQNAFCYGVPLTFLFYVWFITLIIVLLSRTSIRRYAWVLVMLVLFIELKEPFLFKYSFAYFLVMMMMLAHTDAQTLSKRNRTANRLMEEA